MLNSLKLCRLALLKATFRRLIYQQHSWLAMEASSSLVGTELGHICSEMFAAREEQQCQDRLQGVCWPSQLLQSLP